MNYHEKICLVGGGGGVYRMARFLKHIRPNITTVQTMFDCGGHSAKLRDERGMLPPGDIRQAILALADDSIQPMLRELLSFRFTPKNSGSLDGATVGNILLTALTEITGSLPQAINAMCQLYQVRGKVLPVSLDNAHLVVTLSDGSTLKGEGLIDTRSITDERSIISAKLEPSARIYSEAYRALIEADKIVFCPGDFWTSLVPNTLVDGFKDAMKETRAKTIMVVNIMTKKAETHNYTSATFVDKLCEHIGLDSIDVAICNSTLMPNEIQDDYKKEMAYQVTIDKTDRAKDWFIGPFTDWDCGIARHHERVVSTIAGL